MRTESPKLEEREREGARVELGPAPGCVKCLSEFISDIHMTHGCNVNKFSRMHFRGEGKMLRGCDEH